MTQSYLQYTLYMKALWATQFNFTHFVENPYTSMYYDDSRILSM